MSHPHLAAKRTALYRLYDPDGELLYIGITHELGQRWSSHAATKPWWPDVAAKVIEWHETRELAEAAEAVAIATEPTPHNRAGSPFVPRPQKLSDNDVAVGEARTNLSELSSSVRLLRRTYFLTSRGKRQAAVVPAELGELVERAGGADTAAAILSAHLAK